MGLLLKFKLIRNILFHFIFLSALITLPNLGLWQLDRLEWKNELLNNISSRQSAENITFPYNDIERTISILDKYSNDLACVLIDLVPHRVGLIPAEDEFIEALYRWTRSNNTLLVFDEVVTYRANYSGAQQNYSVTPDLTALGKIIGGGFPIGALAGRSDVMSVLDPREKILKHPHSGTFSANPISMTAGYTAMRLFDESVVNKLNSLTSTAIKQIKESIKIADVPVCITGIGSMFRIHLTEKPPTTFRAAYHSDDTKETINTLLNYLFLYI